MKALSHEWEYSSGIIGCYIHGHVINVINYFQKAKPIQDEAELSKVYGKSVHDGTRLTQKQPYLRHQTLPAKPKQPPPPITQAVRGESIIALNYSVYNYI